MNKFAPLLLGSALLLSACNDQEDQVEDRIEEQAE